MSLFKGISPNKGEKTLRDGYRVLLDQSRHVRGEQIRAGEERWSLAELGADDNDLIWLIDWARSLDGWLVNQWLHPGPNRNALGSLLLLFAAEYSRRSLPTDGNWPVPAPQLFSPDSRDHLFEREIPAILHRLALVNAAERLNLHRASGTDWLNLSRTVRFQYGFAEADLGRELPRWLQGQVEAPEAVERLLDPIAGSQSFRSIWRACRAAMSGEISGDELAGWLDASPWILGQWQRQMMRLLPATAEVDPDGFLELPPLPEAWAEWGGTGLDEILELMEQDEGLMVEARGLFARLDADGGWESAMEAVRAINQRALELGLIGRPWSLAELRIDPEADYRWLTDWIERVEAQTLDQCLVSREVIDVVGGPGPCAAGFGLLLLLWMSETGRRMAGEFTLWSSLSREFSGRRSEADNEPPVIFQELDEVQPTSAARLALRAAANHFRLRNLSGIDWFDSLEQTIRLQFGFTRDGLGRHLPDWLSSRATTRVIRELLHGDQRSESFAEVWQAMVDYRQGRLDQERARQALDASPWVLPGWVDEIVPLVTAVGDPLPAEVRTQSPGEFLTAPTLVWHAGGKPHFVTRLVGDLTGFEPTDEALELRIGGRLEAILYRQPDGSYLPDRNGYLRIPFNQPRVRARLVNARGENVRNLVLNLWPPDEEIVLYDLATGRQVADPFCAELQEHRDYALLASSDLQIEPEPEDWRLSRSGITRIGYISGELLAKCSGHLRVMAGRNLFWYPGCNRIVPAWSGQIDVTMARPQVLQQGDAFNLRITHPPEVSITLVRRNRRTLETLSLDQTTTMIRSPFLVTNSVIEIRLMISAVSEDERFTLERILVLSGGRLECYYDDRSTRIREQGYWEDEEAESGPRSISVPVAVPDRLSIDAAVGQVALGFAGAASSPLLELRTPPVVPRSPFPGGFADSGHVVDQSRIKDDLEAVFWDSDTASTPGRIRLRLGRFIQPAPGHEVVIWEQSGRLLRLEPEEYDHTDGSWWWTGSLPAPVRGVIAVAIAVNGRNVATWWPSGNWTFHLREAVLADPYTAACLLRWFHLPLLSEEAEIVLRPIIAANPLQIIFAWLRDELGSGALVMPFRDETWHGIVREYLIHWQPNEAQARELLMKLAGVDNDHDLREFIFDAVQPICRVDPVIMMRVLRAWKLPNREAVLIELRRCFAGVVNVSLINARENALIARAHQLFGFDASFIANEVLLPARQYLSGLPLTRDQQANLEMAARSEELRKLLAIHLLR